MTHTIIDELQHAVLYIGPEADAKRRLGELCSRFDGVLPLWINLYKVVPNGPASAT